jgi:hypothetical protein
METVAATSIAGIMTILSTYLWSQTKRPHYDSQNLRKTLILSVHRRDHPNDYDMDLDG